MNSSFLDVLDIYVKFISWQVLDVVNYRSVFVWSFVAGQSVSVLIMIYSKPAPFVYLLLTFCMILYNL